MFLIKHSEYSQSPATTYNISKDCIDTVRKFYLAPQPRGIFIRFSHENQKIQITHIPAVDTKKLPQGLILQQLYSYILGFGMI